MFSDDVSNAGGKCPGLARGSAAPVKLTSLAFPRSMARYAALRSSAIDSGPC